jgi:Fe-S-cluster-containing dehydrogenase component
VGNDYAPHSLAQPKSGQKWLDLREVEQGQGSKVQVSYIPELCRHCHNPPCAKDAPDGAVYTRHDGVVIIDPVKAKGLKNITTNCPFGVVFWNEELQIPQKCTMCAHMLDAGERLPRCVESCPSAAMFFGDINDADSEIARYMAFRGDFAPDVLQGANVFYRELPAPFITGEIILADRPEDCVEGIKVTCVSAAGELLETSSNFMGDFQFKHLEPDAEYTLSVSYPGYKTFETKVSTGDAQDVGLVTLVKA